MALSQLPENPELAIVSVGHFTEAYPNTLYKARLLERHFGERSCSIIYDLSQNRRDTGLANLKLVMLCRSAAIKVQRCEPGVFCHYS